MFRSLGFFNYRVWFAGALVSNIGTWMQRTAQDWVVLTELTDQDAAAVGVTMALQFGPQLLLVPISGTIADRFDRRKLLVLTQTVMALLGFGLGALVVTGVAELWHVYAFALGLGIAAAIDAPARQTFVAELVPEKNLSNAVALNSASFNGARLAGPAIAGLLTAAVGAGWVFVINGLTFIATIAAVYLLRTSELRHAPRAKKERGQFRQGLRYVRTRPDIIVVLIMVFIVGTFGFNFPIFTSTMASTEFGLGADAYGVLSSVMAIGSVAGALQAARRERPRMRWLVVSSAAFGVACAVASFAPGPVTFGVVLVAVGFSSLTMMTTANALVQTTTAPQLRGRVMAIYMAIFVGGTPIGAPVVGWIGNIAGPRATLWIAAVSGLLAAAVAVFWMVRWHELRVRLDRRAKRLYLVSDALRPDATGSRDALGSAEAAANRG
ncbi:MFS transporter [Herbiconiux sp. SYSU D00978]|uniref:MFS transporter n=1 Tax=Herbiconiux sp. SYSU D00978 TaxID=2812562 RepID=UPI001A96F966